MQVLKKGHSYEVQNVSTNATQKIHFIQKAPASPDSALLDTIQDGTTTEEVLKVVIARVKYLQSIIPCEENEQAIKNLEEALLLLEKRTADRIARGVDGKRIA